MAWISKEIGNIYYGKQCSPDDIQIPDAPSIYHKWTGIEWVEDIVEKERDTILKQIIELESQVTQRRIREAVLGVDNGWLANIESQIAELRARL